MCFGIDLLFWLLSKHRGKCPRCNYPINKESTSCSFADDPKEYFMCRNCGQPIDWDGWDKKKKEVSNVIDKTKLKQVLLEIIDSCTSVHHWSDIDLTIDIDDSELNDWVDKFEELIK